MASASWTIVHLGKLHKVRPDQVNAAFEKLLEDDNDLAWSLVISTYLAEDINLGKAAELLHVRELELRARFIDLDYPSAWDQATLSKPGQRWMHYLGDAEYRRTCPQWSIHPSVLAYAEELA